MNPEHLLKSLLKARQEKGLTQIQLSKLLQLPQSYISQVEQGKHDIRTSTLVDWARILDLEVMLVPRQQLSGISYLLQPQTTGLVAELPAAYGPLPDEVN